MEWRALWLVHVKRTVEGSIEEAMPAGGTREGIRQLEFDRLPVRIDQNEMLLWIKKSHAGEGEAVRIVAPVGLFRLYSMPLNLTFEKQLGKAEVLGFARAFEVGAMPGDARN